MIKLYVFALLNWICSHANGDSLPDKFIQDIITTWRLLSPTVIIDESLPHLCMTYQWMLCLTTRDVDMIELLPHLARIHEERKQDSVIFIGGHNNGDMVKQLDAQVTTYFRSN